MSNPYSRFMLHALPYEVETGYLGSVAVRADQMELSDLSPDRQQFYCKDCFDGHDHFMRLAAHPDRKIGSVPARFNAYNRADSTHQCDHPVRYAELKGLAREDRYAAVHGWSADHNLPAYTFRIAKGAVNSAARMGKVLYATMYDPGLRDLQSLRIGKSTRPLTEALYDDRSKNRLFADAFAAAQAGKELYVATIFRPIGNRGQWLGFTKNDAIPGQAGARVEIDGVSVQPSSVLLCRNNTYTKARQLADRNEKDRSAAMMVIARAVVSLKNVRNRIARLKAGEDLPKAVHVGLIIEKTAQIHAWDHAVSFDAADKGKKTPPVVVEQRKMRFA